MNRIAKFYKVSYEQFYKDWMECFPGYSEDGVETIYNNIKLPKRSTTGSAGYDFFLPQKFVFNEGEYVTIPTGIRCEIAEGWMLECYPRSGLGFKNRMRLANTVGIIDSDYFVAENEGHIHCKVTVEKGVTLEADKAFVQGVFTPFGITVDDDATDIRTGGIGSTDRK